MPQNTYVALRTTVVPTATASVTLDLAGITGYTDLVLVADYSFSGGTNYAVGQVGNGSVDTGSNYSFTVMNGNGSSPSSYRDSNKTYFQLDTNLTGGARAMSVIHFQNYSNTTTNKTIIGRTSAAGSLVSAYANLWRSTAAIDKIKIYDFSGNNITAGSTFTIYGIAAASVGAKATGGTIYQDASYFYHVFSGNGTFTPSQSISADVLVVAGGGAGNDGGGGAGGVAYYSGQSLTATNYTCTVGAGGSGSANGVNSTFGALAAAVGGGKGGEYNAIAAGNGGSGGGAARISGSFGTGTSGQGNNGGSASVGSGNAAGGGGGAGAVGGNNSGATGGAGGIGITTYNSWSQATGIGELSSGVYYLAGGGGGFGGTTAGAAGLGGGGQGSNNSPTPGTNGLANTGGGGGGRAGSVGWGAGGSGVIIVRYAK